MTLFLLTFVGRLKNTFTRTNYFYRVRLIPRSEILAGAEYRMGIRYIPNEHCAERYAQPADSHLKMLRP